MIRIRASLPVVGIAALLVVAVACGSGDVDEPAAADVAGLPLAPTTGVVSSEEPVVEPVVEGAVAVSGMMVSRADSADDLVDRSDIVVIGTITAVLAQKEIGGHDEDGQTGPVEEGGIPVTDYEVSIKRLMKGDGTLVEGGTLVLRMFGLLDEQSDAITLNVFTLPRPGSHLLFALGRNPDGTYGSGPEGLIKVDGDVALYTDGVQFGDGVEPREFVEQVALAASR